MDNLGLISKPHFMSVMIMMKVCAKYQPTLPLQLVISIFTCTSTVNRPTGNNQAIYLTRVSEYVKKKNRNIDQSALDPFDNRCPGIIFSFAFQQYRRRTKNKRFETKTKMLDAKLVQV